MSKTVTTLCLIAFLHLLWSVVMHFFSYVNMEKVFLIGIFAFVLVTELYDKD